MKLPFDLKDIKPGQFAYLTKRKLVNKEKVETGEIIMWKEKGQEESQYVMKCPFCGDEHEGSVVLVKRPYRLRCAKCDRSITLPKLQKEAKKK
jgi:transposase-like protein